MLCPHSGRMKTSSNTTRSVSSFEIMHRSDILDTGSDDKCVDDIATSRNSSGSNINNATDNSVDVAVVVSLRANAGDSNGDIDQVALLSESNLQADEEQGKETDGQIETLTKPVCCNCCCTSLVLEPHPRIGNYCCTLVIEPCQRIGNCRVIFPRLYHRTGIGIVGPHWFGLVSTFALVIGAGALVTRHAVIISATKNLESVKPIICIIFTALTSTFLFLTGCTNPGIVTEANCGYTGVSSGREWRWCQVCRVHQPPKAMHCPDCNVCIAEYDHHCPWMGTCIGKRNFRSFVQFNVSWLLFLMFFIAFIAFQHAR